MADARVREAGASKAPTSSHGARALWWALGTLLVLDLVASLLPGMWLWGFNLARFLPVQLVLALWGAWGIFLVIAGGLGRSAFRRPLRGAALPIALAVATAALCWALPDRTQFTGDFFLREGTVAAAGDPHELFPQALPLDVRLHYTFPRTLIARYGLTANQAGRAIGAAEAALWAVCAWAFVRVLGLGGAPAFGVLAMVLLSPTLGLFTGYSKAFSELALLTLAAGAAALFVAREGRGLLALAIIASLALLIHRSGLTLLPVWLVACVIWLREHGDARGWARPGFLAACALPVVTLALTLPTMIRAMQVIDATHLMPAVVRRTGFVAGTFGLDRLLDLKNLSGLVAPLALVIPFVAIAMGRAVLVRRDVWLLGALLVPQIALLLLVHPLQGVFRDWDVFAAAGVALSVCAAWLAAEALREAPVTAVSLALIFAAAAPAIGWLVLLSQPPRAIARLEARLAGPPTISADEAATGWNFLAFRSFREQHWEQASAGWERAIAYAPNPRYYTQWAMAETMRGDHRHALDLYVRSVELSPDLLLGWLGVAAASSWIDDTLQCRRAAGNIRRLDPRNPQLEAIDAYLRGAAGRP